MTDVVVPSSPYAPRTRGPNLKPGRESQADDIMPDLEELFVIDPDIPPMPSTDSFPEPNIPSTPDDQVPNITEDQPIPDM